ncbi:MAG: putative replicase [Cressdnaviricota sp.]|nr:MAG: putative replicase [Cressdnaviricota sp.]
MSMEGYTQLLASAKKEIHNCITIGLRVHCENDSDIQEWYINHFKDWLKYRDYNLLASTMGIHINTGEHHFHYHCVVQGQLLKNPLATMKRDFELGKVPLQYNTRSAVEKLPTSFIGGKHKSRINLSLKMVVQTDIDKNVFRFLQYPLKEGRTLPSQLYNIDEYGGLNELMTKAKAEYEVAQAKRVKELAKKEKDKSDWDKIVEYLGQSRPSNVKEVAFHILTYYKNQDTKPPTVKFMFDLADRYSFKYGIQTFEELINQRYRYI